MAGRSYVYNVARKLDLKVTISIIIIFLISSTISLYHNYICHYYQYNYNYHHYHYSHMEMD